MTYNQSVKTEASNIINCKKCGKKTGPVFGLCSDCIKKEDSKADEKEKNYANDNLYQK